MIQIQQTTLDNIFARLNDLEMEVKTLSEENKLLKADNIQLKEDNVILKGSVAQLREDNVILKGSVAQLKEDNVILKGSVAQLREDNVILKGSVAQLKEEVSSQSCSIVSLDKRVKHLEISKGMIEEELERLANNIEKNVIVSSVKEKIYGEVNLDPRFEKLGRKVAEYMRNASPDTRNKQSFVEFAQSANELGVPLIK